MNESIVKGIRYLFRVTEKEDNIVDKGIGNDRKPSEDSRGINLVKNFPRRKYLPCVNS